MRGDISAGDISTHRIWSLPGAHWPHMNTKQFRELCEDVLIPLLSKAWEPHFVDIHDVINIMENELMRIADRLDDIDAQLARADEDA